MLEILWYDVSGIGASFISGGFPMDIKPEENIELIDKFDSDLLIKILERLNYEPEESTKTNIKWHRKTLNEVVIPNGKNYANVILRNNDGKIVGKSKIDIEDVPKLDIRFGMDGNGYAYNVTNGIYLRQLVMNEYDSTIDHIERDKLDNRKNKLRVATTRENSLNCKVSKNNTSGVTGVNYRKDRNVWRAYINIDGSQKTLGHYEKFNDAVVARIKGEIKYYKEFAPQRELAEKLGIKNQYIKNKKDNHDMLNIINAYNRANKLMSCKGGTGHDSLGKGITITAMIKAPLYWWKQFDRYTFADTISSTSTMHMILEQDLNQVLLKNTYNSTIDNLRADIKLYKETNDMEIYERIISNLPQGYLYTRGITLNYLQAKTIYYQRKNHKLKEWHSFCDYLENLPHSELFIK